MFYYDDDDFFFRKIVFSNRSRTLIEAAPEKNWFDLTIEAAAYKRHNTVYTLQIQSYFFRTKVVKILIILRTGAKKSSTSSRD